MSLVAAIRDYIDFINSTCDALPLDGGLPSLLVPTFKYILESLKYGTLYLVSFQWVRDLVYLPLIVPNLTLSLLRETCHPFESPVLNFFTFLEMPAYRDNSFVVGLLNSFFVCLPISAGHILSGRRLLVQGIPAGIAAGSGMVLGQWWFVMCVVLGVRSLVVPWLALEPFNYLLGLGLLVNIIYRITHERRIRVVRWGDRKELLQYFLTSLLLSWCEATSFFQYLGNVTLDTGTTLLDSFSTTSLSPGSLQSLSNPFWMEVGYAGGLLVGSCLFSIFFALLALALRGMWLRWGAVTSSRLTNQLNSFFLVTLVALSFASVPYYGMDYLLSNRVGFMSQDTAFDKTVFLPATMNDTTGKLGLFSDNKSFDTDVSTFDRGLYLQQHKPVPQSFEDLNYQGEYVWTKRVGKYTRHIVKRKAPLVWSNLLKRIGENDNLQLSNARDQDRQLKRAQEKMKGIQKGAADGLEGNDVDDINSQSLENDIVKALNSSFLEEGDDMDEDLGPRDPYQNPQDNASYMAERLTEDNETENQFLSLFDTSLSPLFINYMPEASVFEKRLKKRFAENRLYPLLLRVDVDSFLNRQPATHFLSAAEEEALFQKRNILGQYYDTLRQYNQLQNWDQFQTIYRGSKSFANRVYNQQFKGTLRVVRRLFSMTPDFANIINTANESKASNESIKRPGERVLKYDQPLFYQPQKMSHNVSKLLDGKGEPRHPLIFEDPKEDQSSVTEKAKEGTKETVAGIVFNLHEELVPYNHLMQDMSPFVEPTESKPLYAGWDEELRKVVITNRSLPRSEALYKESQPLQGDSLTKGVQFTSWPLPKTTLLGGSLGSSAFEQFRDTEEDSELFSKENLKNLRHQLNFNSTADPRNRNLTEAFDKFAKMQDQGSVGGNNWEMSYWPANLRLLEDQPEPMAYRRGGFVWPGHSSLRFHLDSTGGL